MKIFENRFYNILFKEIKMRDKIENLLRDLRENDNLRTLKNIHVNNKFIYYNNIKMLNLSSNDYLNLASDKDLIKEFLESNISFWARLRV